MLDWATRGFHFHSDRRLNAGGRAGTRILGLLILAGLLCAAGGAYGQVAGDELPPFDLRVNNGAARAQAEQAVAAAGVSTRDAAAQALSNRVEALSVSYHEAFGTPSFVRSTRQFLTEPAPGQAWQDVIGNFVAEYSALFMIEPSVLGQTRISRDYMTAHNGVRHVTLQQTLNGVDVIGAELRANFTAQNELINVSSTLLPLPAQVAEARTPVVSARQALLAAAGNIGTEVTLPPNPSRRQDEWSVFSEGPVAVDAPRARQAYFPLSRTQVRPVWITVVGDAASPNVYEVVVDSENAAILHRNNMTHYAGTETADYLVYTSDSPSPFSPGSDTPDGTQPAIGSRTTETLISMDPVASPNGWIDDGNNETLGNNVDAHTDHDDDNLPDLPRPQGSPYREFAFPIDFAQAPSTYADASVVQLFYYNNLIHDRLYVLGFDEASANFQTDNFGRGGLGNDAVSADAQDGGGTNNANFFTPSDGFTPRMQMYVFTGPTPDRDGSLDGEIVIHEYTHGLSNRLHGGLSALVSRGMGEGWSDFYALCLLSESGDDPHATYAMGGYATYLLGGLTDNYYFGIRRYPYSTDHNKNPETFADIDPNQISFPPPGTVPFSPIMSYPGTANAVHNMGEVWCVTLWGCRANLIDTHGFSGNELMLQLTTDGMKLSPANPNFVEARDAILQADLVNNGGSNLPDLWAGFADRGLGFSATAPASTTSTGVVEAFDEPVFDDLAVSPTDDYTPSGPQGGPFTPPSVTYTLQNNGAASLDWQVVASEPWLSVTSPLTGTLAPGASTDVLIQLVSPVETLAIGTYPATITFTNLTSAFDQTRDVTLDVVGTPNLSVTPTNLDFTLDPDQSQTVSITLENTGTGEAEWAITELDSTPVAVGNAAGPIEVLLLASDSSSSSAQFRNALATYTDLSLTYVDAGTTTPTAGDLAAYDAVVLWTNGPLANSVALGDALADYVDAGGAVVEASAAFGTGGGWELMGRFVTDGYTAFTHGSASFATRNLGTHDPSHPVMSGVSSLSCGLLALVSLAAGAESVAEWDDGVPLVATQGERVVSINLFPLDTWWTGDAPLLFRNAIVHLADDDWLSVSPFGGTLAPGASTNIDVTADSTGLSPGFFASKLLSISGDPDGPVTVDPVTLTVGGASINNVAIFQDALPWGLTSNEDTLTANGITYTVLGSPDIGVVDLSPYDKVIVSSVQSESFYDLLDANSGWFESYVSAGGLLDLHLAHYSGTADGNTMPGGFVMTYFGADDVTVVETTHAIVNAPNAISDPDLDNWGSSTHGYFSTVPIGAVELVEITSNGEPCAMELPMGLGRILATMQTVEWHNASPEYLENTLLYHGGTTSSEFVQVVEVGHEPVSTFPIITSTVFVDSEAGRTCSLDIADFAVTEDGVAQTLISATCAATGSAKADIVLLFDDTGSMVDEIAVMQAEATSFATEILAEGVDAQFGLVSFADVAEIDLALTTDVVAFQMAVNGLVATGGGDTPEVSLDAVMLALDSMAFRPDAQKILVLVTDAPAHYRGDGSGFSSYTMPEVVAAVNAAPATVFAVSPDFSLPLTLTDNEGNPFRLESAIETDTDVRILADETGGFWQDISGADFTLIVDEIVDVVTSLWTLVYETTNAVADGTTRLVSVTVADPRKGVDSDSGTYIAPVCALPGAPVDPTPADGAVDVPVDTLLSWNTATIGATTGSAAMHDEPVSSIPPSPFGDRLNSSLFTTDDNEDNAGSGNPDFDMDVYLYKTDPLAPIEFNIDYPGGPTPASVQLLISNWDVDETSGEVDGVYFNGVRVGTLTGANNEWSTTVLNIDPGLLVTGDNLVRIDIDEETAGSWAVTIDWGQLIIDGAAGEASIRYAFTDKFEYLQGETVVGTVEVDTTAASQNVVVETNLLDPSGTNVAGTSRSYTTANGDDDPFDVPLLIPVDAPSGSYDFQVLVFDQDTLVLQDQLAVPFIVGAACPTVWDVYLDGVLLAADISVPQANPGLLLENTAYEWQVVAKSPSGDTPGPTWSFTTETLCPLPAEPANPTPADGAVDVPVDTTLSWSNAPLSTWSRRAAMSGAVMHDEPVTEIPPSPFSDRLNSSLFTTDDNEDNAGSGNPDFDMDVYLFKTDPLAPIEFNIDYPGGPTPSSVQLLLSNWDVDETSGEVDGVYFNGVRVGTLTGANNEWSTTVLNIDPGLLVTGNNLVRIDIDEETEGSWAVTIDWGQLVIDGTVGEASIRYASTDAFEYVQGDTVIGTVEVDTTAASQDIVVETNLLDPFGTNVAGTNRSYTTLNGDDDPFDVPLIIPVNAPSGAYQFQVLVFDQDTLVLQDQSTVPFNVGSACPTVWDVYLDGVLIASETGVPQADPGLLLEGTLYEWQVVAKGPDGSTPGPIWSFTTEVPCPVPPAPITPAPTDGAIDVPLNTYLTWLSDVPAAAELASLVEQARNNSGSRNYPSGFDPRVIPPGTPQSKATGSAMPVPFFDDMESGANGWTADGFWHQITDPQNLAVSEEINPRLVLLPDATGQLPSAFSGSTAWWYGEDATGTFIGNDFDRGQPDLSGGTSTNPNFGSLVSPAIDLTSATAGSLTFKTWWEIEGVDSHAFDLMFVEISVDGGTIFTPLGSGTINPIDDVNSESWRPYSSGGVGEVGEWISVHFDLTPYVGNEVVIRFRFETGDQLYNGFRGWFIDDVQVSGNALPAPTITDVSPGTGAVGSVFTVTGTNFQNGAQVTLDSFPALTIVNSSTQAQVVVPNVPLGVYDVTLTNPDSQSAIAVDAYEVSASAPPSITSVNPAWGYQSEATWVVIAGSNFDPNANVSVGGVVLGYVNVLDATTISAIVPPGLPLGFQNVTVTNPNGQFDTLVGGFEVVDGGGSCPLVWDVYLDGVLLFEDLDIPAAGPLNLAPGTSYEWQVVAKNGGGSTAGANWSFTTITPDGAAPTVTITAPTTADAYATSNQVIDLGGTAADNVGVTQVTWKNNMSGSGVATGTAAWTALNIPLHLGDNLITVTAHDAAGNTGTDQILVTYHDDPAFLMRDGFRGLDTSGDGRISLAESGLDAGTFDALDTDNNGYLTLAELLAQTVGPPGVVSPVWVDFGFNGSESGTEGTPFNTLDEAMAYVASGGEIRVKAGATPLTYTGMYALDKPVTVVCVGGNAMIGGVPVATAAPAQESADSAGENPEGAETGFWRRLWDRLTGSE